MSCLTVSIPPLQATLSFTDMVEHVVIKNAIVSDSFSLSDDISVDLSIALTENLPLVDAPLFVDRDGQILVQLEEDLDLDDIITRAQVLPISLQESLLLEDTLNRNAPFSFTDSLAFSDVVFAEVFIPSSPNYKIQHGTFIIPVGSFSATIEGTGQAVNATNFDQCTGECFMMQVSSRQWGMGPTSGGFEDAEAEDFTTYISNDGGLTSGGTITVTRDGDGSNSGTDDDNRIAWQIIEYTGPTGGLNEMKVLATGNTQMLAGTDDATVSGITTANNDNDVAVIVTGVSSTEANVLEIPAALVTTEWIGASDAAVFNRTSTAVDIDISYAVVEFTSNNWNLQRIEHVGTDIPTNAEQTESITDVGDLSRAFVLQAQQRNADGEDTLCETGERVWLSDTDILSFNHETITEACTYNSNMNRVAWILSNSNTETGQRMIVEHQLPVDQLNTVDPNPPEEENWQVTINSLTYGTDETSILGFTSNSDGTSTNFPSGTIVADLTDSTTVDFWQSESGEEQSYSFSVVQWPRSLQINLSFNESLSLSDDVSIDLRLSLTEDLLLDDGVVDTMNAASVSLIENLILVDDIDRTIPVSLDESLSLDDGTVNTDATINVALTESLEFNEIFNKMAPASFTESLTFSDSETSLLNIAENQILIEEALPSITVTEGNQELVILSSDTQLDNIDICANDNSGIENTVLNYTALLVGTSVTITNG